jgi:hypothetical protein
VIENDDDGPLLPIPSNEVTMFGKAIIIFTAQFSDAVRRGLRNATSQKATTERWIHC